MVLGYFYAYYTSMNWFRNPQPVWENGYSFIRIIIGLSLLYHGKEVADSGQMNSYGKWLTELDLPFPYLLAYLGKGSEFLGGLLVMIGLFTRAACILILCTFLGITFLLGHGKIFMDDQHPFLFVILSLIYLFIGPGKLSVDAFFASKK
jgi:putative oxidoreductase